MPTETTHNRGREELPMDLSFWIPVTILLALAAFALLFLFVHACDKV